jgi:siroheme synthase
MGIGNIVKITQELELLIKEKLPAIIIANASLMDEKVIYTDINNLAQQIINHNISSPALIYLGDNIALKKALKPNTSDFFIGKC